MSKPSRPRRRWLRYSIRSVLLLILLVALPLGWLVPKLRHVRSQRLAVDAVIDLRGRVTFDKSGKLAAPVWWHRALDFQVPGTVLAIDLSYRDAEDRHVAHFDALESLRELNLIGTDVGDDGLARLAGLEQLKSLKLNYTRVTDEGLRHLAGLQRLETLLLYGTQVSAAGLAQLKQLKALRELDVGGTRLTRADVEALRAALPECRVHWEAER